MYSLNYMVNNGADEYICSIQKDTLTRKETEQKIIFSKINNT